MAVKTQRKLAYIGDIDGGVAVIKDNKLVFAIASETCGQ